MADQTHAASALLQVGAACAIPAPSTHGYTGPLFPDSASPLHWLAQRSSSHRDSEPLESGAGMAATKAAVLGPLLARHSAGSLQLSADQLLGLLMVAMLHPASQEAVEYLAGLPGAAEELGEQRRRQLLHRAMDQGGDLATASWLLQSPFCCDPLDPSGEPLSDAAASGRADAVRLLLQASYAGSGSDGRCAGAGAVGWEPRPFPERQPHAPLCVMRSQHASHSGEHQLRRRREGARRRSGAAAAGAQPAMPVPPPASAFKIQQAAVCPHVRGAPAGSLALLQAGQPRVPQGSTQRPASFYGGEHDLHFDFLYMTCPFYSLFRQ